MGWSPYLGDRPPPSLVGTAIGLPPGLSVQPPSPSPSFVVTPGRIAGLAGGRSYRYWGQLGRSTSPIQRSPALANNLLLRRVRLDLLRASSSPGLRPSCCFGHRRRVAAGSRRRERCRRSCSGWALVAAISIVAVAVLKLRPRRAAGAADPARLRRPAWSTWSRRTRFGRHVYAVGGSAEAARAGGHPGQRACGWAVFRHPPARWRRSAAIMAASRLLAVNQGLGRQRNCCCSRSPAR